MDKYSQFTKERLIEIATVALSNLFDCCEVWYARDLIGELDMSREEAEFFGIEDYMNDEEEDNE